MEHAEEVRPTIWDRIRWKRDALVWRFAARWRAACDWLKWLGWKEGNSEAHARRELLILGLLSDPDPDSMNRDMAEHILRMVKAFSEEGHSGFSARYAVNLLEKLLRFEPLAPLTGKPMEWSEPINNEGTLQNKRASHVFKDADGQAYDIQGKVFREPDGCTFTSGDSRVPVTFPYTPSIEYVDVPKEEDEADAQPS